MKQIKSFINTALKGLGFLTPLADLGIRLFLAEAFWKAGIIKFSSMDSTLWLFTHEYKVPLLSPLVASYLGTGVELLFPVLLVLGMAGRFSAGVLFIYNILAVISYPGIHPAGFQWHIVWGLMLLVTITHGPGKLSIDYLIHKKLSSDTDRELQM